MRDGLQGDGMRNDDFGEHGDLRLFTLSLETQPQESSAQATCVS